MASLIIEAAEDSTLLAPFAKDYRRFQSIIIFCLEIYDTSSVFFALRHICYGRSLWINVTDIRVTCLCDDTTGRRSKLKQYIRSPMFWKQRVAVMLIKRVRLSRSIDGSRNIQFLSSHHEASKRRDILHEWAKFLQPAFIDEGSKQCCHHLRSITCIHCEMWGTGRRAGR